jgi:hypothetical protein
LARQSRIRTALAVRVVEAGGRGAHDRDRGLERQRLAGALGAAEHLAQVGSWTYSMAR